jgi:SAM-dependent methyltransferase
VKENKEAELDSGHYDTVYSLSKVYSKDPEHTPYFKMWSAAADIVSKLGGSTIVDLGCGPGHFPKVLIDREILGFDIKKYFGYDFSKVSLQMAKKLVDNNPLCTFDEQDLLKYDFSLSKPKESVYVSFEFLEHIYEDLSVVGKIPSGARICFSVPSFNATGHVRWFDTKESVESR